MIVAKLAISYDRGTALNKPGDIGAALKKGDPTADGGVVRGLGSRFRSQAEMQTAQARDKEAHRVYRAFRERFMTTTIDGLYIVQSYGEARDFIAGLNPQGIDVRVAEFELQASPDGIDAAELGAWGERIRRQVAAVSLGRKKETDATGLRAVRALAECPILSEKTRDEIKNLVGFLETAKIDRAEFRKRVEALNVEIAQIDRAHDKRVEKVEERAGWLAEAA